VPPGKKEKNRQHKHPPNKKGRAENEMGCPTFICSDGNAPLVRQKKGTGARGRLRRWIIIVGYMTVRVVRAGVNQCPSFN